MKTTKKISLLIWNLNKAAKGARQSFIIETFYGIETVLDAIYLDGWILGYKKYESGRYFEVFLKYDASDKTVITRAINITKPNLASLIRLQELSSDCKSTACTGIIRTAKYGFLQNRQAFIKKVGGIYLAKIF